MTLHVHTARMSYCGPDRFDITRKSGCVEGRIFAPTWATLGPALRSRKAVDDLRAAGYNHNAGQIEAAAWDRYVPLYTAEMRVSYQRRRVAWNGLLARERVVLVCYCTDPNHCHRRLLAGILVKLGAVDEGEHAATD